MRNIQSGDAKSAQLSWQSLVLLAVAITLCAATFAIRTVDSRYPTISEIQLREQQIGIYLDRASEAALMQVGENQFEASGGRIPERRWDFSIDPGRTAKGKVTLILLDAPGSWNLSIQHETRVVIALPPGTVLDDELRELRSESSGSCASWYDGQKVSYAYPTAQRSHFGNLVAECTIPPVGDVDDLFFEMAFHWTDETFAEAGFGRTAGAARFEYIAPFPSDIELPRSSQYTLDDMTLSLILDDGERLMESFPNPTGGSRGKRTWDVPAAGGDIEYLVERPASRAWVQPTSDLALLLAGVTVGLISALGRRRRGST